MGETWGPWLSCPETYGKTIESQRFDFDEVDEGEKHFETGMLVGTPDMFRGQVVLLDKEIMITHFPSNNVIYHVL